MSERPRPALVLTGLRFLLGIGAAISIITGLSAMFSPRMLETALGLGAGTQTAAYLALARLYGGVVVAVGVGYLFAMARPFASPGLLAVCFLVPLSDLAGGVAGIAAGQMSAMRGGVFVVVDAVYCLLLGAGILWARNQRDSSR